MVIATRRSPIWVQCSNMLLPGLLAWVATVGVPAFSRGVGGGARTIAMVSLAAMMVGPFVAATRPAIGRAVGIHAAVGLALLTWVLLGSRVGVQHVEPVRSAIGAVAWVLFAFGWGAVRAPGSVPEDDPRAIPGPPLAARSQLPFGATSIFALGLAGASLPVFAAWRVTRPSHALLAHAVAVVCAIALVTAAAHVAAGRRDWKPVTPAGARLGAAVRPLTLLAVVLILRFIWMLLR